MYYRNHIPIKERKTMTKIDAQKAADGIRMYIEDNFSTSSYDVKELLIESTVYPIQRIVDFHLDEDTDETVGYFIETYRFNKFEADFDDVEIDAFEDELIDGFYETQELAWRYLDEMYDKDDILTGDVS